ncbi:MAG: DNA alkylation repair protein [Schleiferilactobacillus perolens]|uniref:DNA alkylation repair protein n=1 Tax=Schleiferilactobacillus perolens TaxID=100468 RepID=UPI0039E96BC2
MDILTFQLIGDPAKAPHMAKYMKDQFPFLGLPTPMRKSQSKALLKASREQNLATVRRWITDLYQREAREYQYVAIDLALANVKYWQFPDIQFLQQFVGQKSWWDTVDAWRKVFAMYVRIHPDQKPAVFALFFDEPDFWLRRVGINLQLLEKETQDTAMLSRAILADQDTGEFFIQKAIGWSLRQYSKYDPTWVQQFLNAHKLSPLAVREASKYLSAHD